MEGMGGQVKSSIGKNSKIVGDFVKEMGVKLSSSLIKQLEEESGSLPAVGYQYSFTIVHLLAGISKGKNAMFFPATCEFAKYNFINGMFSTDKDQKTLGDLFSRRLTYGLFVGGGAELVVGYPMGTGDHNADSWLGWFGSVLTPVASGFTGLPVEKSQWYGVSAGGPFSPAVGGAYVTTYFTYSGNNYDDSVEQYSDDRCTCAALRLLSKSADQMKKLMGRMYGF